MPWDDDDEALVTGLKVGDSAAVQYAVETYAPKLFRYATYQLGNRTAAEDLVSEVITRMLEKIGGYKSTGAPFQAWLFAIARNLVADGYRRDKSERLVSLEEDIASDHSETYGLGSDDPAIESLPDRDALVRVLSLLTSEQRQILTLRLVEGWQPTEIAAHLGRSLDSVKSLQYRALQAMKRHLEAGMEPEMGRVARLREKTAE